MSAVKLVKKTDSFCGIPIRCRSIIPPEEFSSGFFIKGTFFFACLLCKPSKRARVSWLSCAPCTTLFLFRHCTDVTVCPYSCYSLRQYVIFLLHHQKNSSFFRRSRCHHLSVAFKSPSALFMRHNVPSCCSSFSESDVCHYAFCR